MKTIADKFIVMGSDIAGFSLKEAIKKHLVDLGWTVEDVGVTDPYAPNPMMFHRVGFKVGSKISEKEYERGLIFCGTGMGIHIAANKCPGVQAAVVESVRSAKRASQANNTNVLAMGGFWMSPTDGIEAVDEWLGTKFGEGWEETPFATDYHKLAYDEIDQFDYEAYKANGFEPVRLGDVAFPEGHVEDSILVYKVTSKNANP
ncbi:MAG: RpiB/LacA/LacB family sugar-phosphate isomerase [Oscillospiraceae bacterium]|nr:RpiB/LacA/LacB family sugar-phosphate isomerase [Oscillospiraceae bacterium]